MLSKKQIGSLIALAVIGLAIAFVFLQFWVGHSSTKAENQISTFSSGFENGESLPPNAPVSLVVAGKDSLTRKITRQMERKFLDGPITRVVLEEAVQTEIDQFQVYISLDDRALVWTPFIARSRLKVSFAFSSSGDLSWMDEDVVAFTSDQGQVVAIRGNIQLSDQSFGMISWPAYQTHLADELALQIDEAIRNSLASPANPASITNP